MIKIGRLTKKFGSLTAVSDVTFSVGRGEVFGFLGPNGAGKSTTMKMVTGYLPITSGMIEVCGHDITREPNEAKRKIGYLPEGAPLYGDMSGLAFLEFIAEIRGFRGDEKSQRVESVIEKLELNEVVNKPIDTLSKGFKRRVGLAQAILHDPDILILDEPTDGLDPNQKHQVRNLIKEMAPDKAIIISTHLLEEVSAVCSRAVIIAAGSVVFDGSPEEFAARSSIFNAVIIKSSDPQLEKFSDELMKVSDVERVEKHNTNSLIVIPKSGISITEKVSLLVQEKRFNIDELYTERGHLDDVFRKLTVGK